MDEREEQLKKLQEKLNNFRNDLISDQIESDQEYRLRLERIKNEQGNQLQRNQRRFHTLDEYGEYKPKKENDGLKKQKKKDFMKSLREKNYYKKKGIPHQEEVDLEENDCRFDKYKDRKMYFRLIHDYDVRKKKKGKNGEQDEQDQNNIKTQQSEVEPKKKDFKKLYENFKKKYLNQDQEQEDNPKNSGTDSAFQKKEFKQEPFVQKQIRPFQFNTQFTSPTERLFIRIKSPFLPTRQELNENYSNLYSDVQKIKKVIKAYCKKTQEQNENGLGSKQIKGWETNSLYKENEQNEKQGKILLKDSISEFIQQDEELNSLINSERIKQDKNTNQHENQNIFQNKLLKSKGSFEFTQFFTKLQNTRNENQNNSNNEKIVLKRRENNNQSMRKSNLNIDQNSSQKNMSIENKNVQENKKFNLNLNSISTQNNYYQSGSESNKNFNTQQNIFSGNVFFGNSQCSTSRSLRNNFNLENNLINKLKINKNNIFEAKKMKNEEIRQLIRPQSSKLTLGNSDSNYKTTIIHYNTINDMKNNKQFFNYFKQNQESQIKQFDLETTQESCLQNQQNPKTQNSLRNSIIIKHPSNIKLNTAR